MKKLTRQLSLGADAGSSLRRTFRDSKDKDELNQMKAEDKDDKAKPKDVAALSKPKPARSTTGTLSLSPRGVETGPALSLPKLRGVSISNNPTVTSIPVKRQPAPIPGRMGEFTPQPPPQSQSQSQPQAPQQSQQTTPPAIKATPKMPKIPPPVPPVSLKPPQLSPRVDSSIIEGDGSSQTDELPTHPLVKSPSTPVIPSVTTPRSSLNSTATTPRSSLNSANNTPRSSLSSSATVLPSISSLTDSTPTTPTTPRPSSPPKNDLDDSKWADPEKEAYRQRQNKNVLEELVNTETEYIKDLETIIEHVMKPMATKKNFMTGNLLVTPAQVSAIFSTLPLLPPLNFELERMLSAELESFSQGNDAMIGKIFLSVADFFRMYSHYFANQPQSIKTISELRKESSQFDAFLDEKRDLHPEFKNLDLQAMLIKPTQRMCKYPLFLRELVNYTRKSHPDYTNLVAALEKVDSVVKEINERKRETENQTIISEIRYSITGLDDEKLLLMKQGRALVKQAQFKKVIWKGNSFKGSIYIFNDIALVTKAKDKKQGYKLHVELDKINSITESEVGEKASLTNLKKAAVFPAFIVHIDSDQVTFICSSPEERKQWADAITNAKTAYLEKLAAPTRSIAIKESK